MCEIMDNLIQKEIKTQKIDFAEILIKRGKSSLTEIVEDLGLSLEEVEELNEKINSSSE